MRKMMLCHSFPEARERLEQNAEGWQLLIKDEVPNAAEAAAECEILIAPEAGDVDAALTGNALRWIQSWGAGVERLPLAQLKARGILVSNTSGVHGRPIAESIFSLILAFARGVDRSIPAMQRRAWEKGGIKLWEVHGSTIGILGMGAIGVETARIAKAFSMRVLGLRRSHAESPYVDEGFTMEGLDRMLPACDIVVNILPLTAETHRLMDARRFLAMKPTATYISVGRGGTTDQDALIDALQNGNIGYAGLDVTDPEPLGADSPLWGMPNVIITPHIAGQTQHYDARALEIFLENFAAYRRDGRLVRNAVDLDLGY